MILTRCQRCGRIHDSEEKCRLRWGRRGFLAMLGAIPAMAATGLPELAESAPRKGLQVLLAYAATTGVTLCASVLVNGKWESCTVNLPRYSSPKEHSITLPINVTDKDVEKWSLALDSSDKPFECHSINRTCPRSPIKTTNLAFYQDVKAEQEMHGWMY